MGAPLLCWAGVQPNFSFWSEPGQVGSMTSSHQSSSVTCEVGIPVSLNQVLLPNGTRRFLTAQVVYLLQRREVEVVIGVYLRFHWTTEGRGRTHWLCE